jgi:hypothetical protein
MQKRVYLKHMLSCLADQAMTIEVDDERERVVVRCAAFDAHLIARLVMRVLPEQHGVIAYRDDANPTPTWTTPAAPCGLVIEFAGVEYRAQVVRLFDGESVAVTLEPRQ